MVTTTAPPTGAAENLDVLERQTRNGDPQAMLRLAARLAIGAGAPHDPRRAISLLEAAGDLGEADALSLRATLTAVGAAAPPDWATALSLLGRAATMGSASARAQLRLLATGSADAGSGQEAPDVWARLVEQVDIRSWMAPPDRTALCEAPRVRMAKRFATPEVCDWIRRKAEGRLRPALMYHGDSRSEVEDPHRTCGDYQFDILNSDLVLLLVRERVAALTKLPCVAMEPPRIFHYALGQEIKPHFDRCGDAVNGYGIGTGYRGDRIVTFLLYLNEGFDGGDLDFPRANFRCKGAKGDAVYFAHVDTEGRQDPLSLHAGLKILRGEKWVLSQWIHDRPFGMVTPPPAEAR